MPLLWASYQGFLDVAEVLVNSGAALSATDKASSLLRSGCLAVPPLRQPSRSCTEAESLILLRRQTH